MDAVEVSKLSFSYESGIVLEDISFRIKQGDFVGIIGPNGSGKSTLIRIIVGLLKPQKGSVKIFGMGARQFKNWGDIGYVPQRSTVGENFPANVDEILSLRENGKKDEIARLLELDGIRGEKFSNLSGGQQQKVLIALALLSGPKLLILDEPAVGVDIKAQQSFYELLKQINEEKGVTIVLVTHDVGVIPAYAHSIICINRTVCCTGKADRLEEMLEKVYGREARLFSHRHGHTHHHHHKLP